MDLPSGPGGRRRDQLDAEPACLRREVGSTGPYQVGAASGLLPLLLTAQGCEVEEGIGATSPLGASTEVGVGVEHLVPDPEEDAVAGLLLRAARRDRQRGAQRVPLLGGAVVE